MSIVNRVSRPLSRDRQTYRDDRLFVVACDDTYAPKQYFDSFRISRVQVHIVPTRDGTSAAQHVLSRLEGFKSEVKQDEGDELWMLLDTDHYATGQHQAGFLKAIQAARHQGIKVALSKPCFELWLLLHLTDDLARLRELADAKAAGTLMQELLGAYNKTRINVAAYTPLSVRDACERGVTLDTGTGGGDIPTAPTSRVYQLWDALLQKASQAQLHPDFLAIRGVFTGSR